MTLEDAITEARAQHENRKLLGFDQDALEDAARLGFQNGEFEDAEDDIPDVLEEFFPEGGIEDGPAGKAKGKGKPSLQDKLDSKAVTMAKSVGNGPVEEA